MKAVIAGAVFELLSMLRPMVRTTLESADNFFKGDSPRKKTQMVATSRVEKIRT